MAGRRRRAQAAAADQEMEIADQREATTLERLVELLDVRGAGGAGGGGRDRFRAPEFDGRVDVDLFISQFMEVAEANRWEEDAALLHLRESLKSGARECGRAGTLQGVFTALRARYGLTMKEARAILARIRKEASTTLQEHATQIEKLVNLAYSELPAEYRAGLLVDQFSSTLGNAGLQRHLLAVPTPTLEDAVRAGNEFLQVQPTLQRPARPSIQTVDEEEEEGQVQGVGQESRPSPKPAPTPVEPMAEMLKALTALTQQLVHLQAGQ